MWAPFNILNLNESPFYVLEAARVAATCTHTHQDIGQSRRVDRPDPSFRTGRRENGGFREPTLLALLEVTLIDRNLFKNATLAEFDGFFGLLVGGS